MNTHADKTQENKSQAVYIMDSQMQSTSQSTFQFVDNRSEAIAQRKLQEMANNSPQVSQLKTGQDTADKHSSKQQQPLQKKENNTGLPDNLKTGMENLSGISLDDVKVHRNSNKPAQLQAHAYAQGTDIHLGPGQEKHLPHEAWHVVQQKQGRVKPTVQMKGKVKVNDDEGLEKEADVMGADALQFMGNRPEYLVQRKSKDLPKLAIQQKNEKGITQFFQVPEGEKLLEGEFAPVLRTGPEEEKLTEVSGGITTQLNDVIQRAVDGDTVTRWNEVKPVSERKIFKTRNFKKLDRIHAEIATAIREVIYRPGVPYQLNKLKDLAETYLQDQDLEELHPALNQIIVDVNENEAEEEKIDTASGEVENFVNQNLNLLFNEGGELAYPEVLELRRKILILKMKDPIMRQRKSKLNLLEMKTLAGRGVQKGQWTGNLICIESAGALGKKWIEVSSENGENHYFNPIDDQVWWDSTWKQFFPLGTTAGHHPIFKGTAEDFRSKELGETATNYYLNIIQKANIKISPQ